MLKIGVVGVGSTVSIAHNHIKAFESLQDCCVSAIYSTDRNKVQKVIDALAPQALNADSFQQLLDNCDAVVICTPNSWHFHYASLALKNNKHVLLEKPMGVSLSESSELCRLAVGKVAMVGYCNRFLPCVQQARRIIAENFTSIYSVDVSHGGLRLANPNVPFEWRMDSKLSGDGALCDFGSHVIDLVNYLCNARLQRLWAVVHTVITHREYNGDMRLVENDDCSSVVGSGDVLFSLTASRVGLDGMRVEISGDGGLLRFDDRQDGLLQYLPKFVDGSYGSEWQQLHIQQDRQQLFDRQAQAFVDAVNGKTSTCSTFVDGLYAEQLLANCVKLQTF